MIERPFIFKINEKGTGPNLLYEVCLERGWKEYIDEEGSAKDNWNIWWKTNGAHFTANCKPLKVWQFINHIPKATIICRKDSLSKGLKFMKNSFGGIYDFSPDAYVLPCDFAKLMEQCNRSLKAERHGKKCDDIWICKPVALSQGKGITLFKKITDLSYESMTVVQRYVQNPLLIGGYKFDLRLYVCVPCFHPLTIYVYREGLARFSTDKFSLDDLTNKYAHLTNCSLNKQSPHYMEMKDKVGAGCKWTLKQLRYYFNQNGYDDWYLWQRISIIIVLTVLSQISGIPMTANCFEFYGFDILIDSTFKPWLLEVNTSPALITDCDVDPAVKKPMLHDLFDLLGLPFCNTGLSLFSSWGNSANISCNSDGCYEYNHEKVIQMANKWKKQIVSSAKRKSADKDKYGHNSFARQEATTNRLLRKPNELKKMDMGQFTHLHNQNEKSGGGRGGKQWTDPKWDNGVDWRFPTAGEGDWVRVYPLKVKAQGNPPTIKSKEGEARWVVGQMSKYAKSLKEVLKEETKTDDERDFLIYQVLKVADSVWHPLL